MLTALGGTGASAVPMAANPGHAQAAAQATGKSFRYSACSGRTYFSASVSSGRHVASEHGWYWTNSTQVCVGQIDYHENYTGSTDLAQRIRIWATDYPGGPWENLLVEAYNLGGVTNGSTINFSPEYIRQKMPANPVLVCSALVHDDVVDGFPQVRGVPVVCKRL